MFRHTRPLLFLLAVLTWNDVSIAREPEEALIAAAAAGREKDVTTLLKLGADINAVSAKDGWSALSLAAENGHLATVSVLIQGGARVDQVVNQGLTALQRAVSGRHLDVARFLIQHGADVQTRRIGGRTLLMDAADAFYSNRESHAAGIVMTLLARGIDINARDSRGYTALMLAAQEGQEAIVQILLRNGADVEVRGEDGKSAIDLARDRKHSKIVDRLVRESAVAASAQSQ